MCLHVLFFENVQCGRCGHALAYLPDLRVLSPLEPDQSQSQTQDAERAGDKAKDSANGTTQGATIFVALAPEAKGRRVRLCDNYAKEAVCNWAVPVEPQPSEATDSGTVEPPEKADVPTTIQTLCRSCQLNRVIPNLADANAKHAWHKLESAKRRVVYTLLTLGLPREQSLGFSFKEDQVGEKVYTGHSDGLITINIAEADDVYREKMRGELGETYRTVLGHVRHEIGHYYWDRLIATDPEASEAFRALFGDEREDYPAAKDRHYASGPPSDWRANFVSAYAAMHPWEDWAESFAHYLHMLDTLETAQSYGLTLRSAPEASAAAAGLSIRDLGVNWLGAGADANVAFEQMIAAWFPLTIALNSLNRSMGLYDSYPFVLSARAVEKLCFVHGVVAGAVASARAAS